MVRQKEELLLSPEAEGVETLGVWSMKWYLLRKERIERRQIR